MVNITNQFSDKQMFAMMLCMIVIQSVSITQIVTCGYFWLVCFLDILLMVTLFLFYGWFSFIFDANMCRRDIRINALEADIDLKQEVIDEAFVYMWLNNYVDRRRFSATFAAKMRKDVYERMEAYYKQVGQPTLPFEEKL